MGVLRNSTGEAPRNVQAWMNGHSDNSSRPLMTKSTTCCSMCRGYLGEESSNVQRCSCCGRTLCEKCEEGQYGSAECCCGYANGFEEENHENDGPSSLSSERMDESTGPVLSGSAEAKIEQLVSNQQFASNRFLHYSFSSPRSGYEYDNDSERNFFTPSSSFSLATTSDTDSISMTTSRSTSGFSTLKSFPPTPLEIPSKALENSDETTPTSRRRSSPSALSDEEPTQDYEIAPTSINLDTNSLIWLPPVAADEDADTETNIYEFDEDEDTNGFFVNSGSDEDEFGGKTSSLTSQKEALRSELGGHFKVLVAQLLEGELVSDTWLEIVSGLAWEAANFVKPDTSKGDSMDPGKYVKVKCIASGSQNDCTFVKGVVCSKNVKHKRMVAQHTNPRLVLIGGALDYEKKLASFDTTFERENDHLKNIVSQIKAQKPNVLLVEKSVSPYAQEILSQDISLVLNVKKKLLETIARCVGAQIASCRETIGSSHVGRCLVFRTEKVTTECVLSDNSVKKVVKTLMFFEGCPKRLGCTVLLRGASLEELKKVKRVIQFAAFAAYHLSLETSFLADERAFLPKAPKVVLFPNGSNSLANGLSASEDFSEESVPAGEIALEEVNKQSILVYLSTTCSLKGSGTVCDQSKLFKIKFYGSNDKPLGRFLHDDLFTQAPYCGSCNEPTENHVLCYSHQQGSLTISMKRLTSSSVRLPGQRDGKIWMWHRCLRCKPVNGIPPATTRVLMSSSAWGLSFGKFLELGFSNHTTANRVANCGHSLQRDCLRFYGCGNMVAVFRYSPVDILAVNLPPSVMDFTNRVPVKWVKDQISEIYTRADCLHAEVSHVLNTIKSNVLSSNDETLILRVHEMVVGFRDKIQLEKNEYKTLLELVASESAQPPIDVLELNRWRRRLINNASKWDHSLFNLDSYSKGNNNSAASDPSLLEASSRRLDENASPKLTECNSNSIVEMDLSIEGLSMVSGQFNRHEEDESSIEASSESISPSSILSEQIFLHWTGSTDQLPFQTDLFGPVTRKALAPVRVHSFESALIPTSLAKETLPNIRRAYSQRTPKIDDVASPQMKSNYRILNASFTILSDGARVPQLVHTNTHDIFIDIYDEELTSIVASAMTSQEYNSFVSSESHEHSHFRVSFDDGGSFHTGDKGRYSVTCYFAKQFDSLRKACCPSEIDFVRSISRCKKWSAHGGKSNAYFAKTLDERFIVKQVTRTELDSFEDFGSGYFKHMTESLTTCSPTSLAKVVGLFQVVAKNLKGGKEMKMDFMVMENLFFGRNISRIYDLKGSLRSRYNHDSEGDNKVLLDLNLLETLHTKPIFLGSKSKLYLERAVWNDTSFLAAGDVMDYSLLVGIDEEKKELVIGIIDYLRQYTWDKQLETWVKASGILGGPKNTPPTVISPDQYKKRFRKAMSRYFLTLHNQLSS